MWLIKLTLICTLVHVAGIETQQMREQGRSVASFVVYLTIILVWIIGLIVVKV